MQIAFLFSSPMMVGFLKPHIKALLERGENVSIFFNRDDDKFGYVDDLIGTVSLFHVPIARKLSFGDLYLAFKMRSQLGLYDLVITVGPKSLLIGGVAKWFGASVKFVHLITGQVWSNKRGVSRWILRTVERLLLFKYELGLADSPAQEVFLRSRGYRNNVVGFRPGSVKGIDVEYFDPSIVKPQQSLFSNTNIPVVGYIGRVTKEKGIHTLVNANRSFQFSDSPFNLLIVGPLEDDSYKECLSNSDFIKHIGFTNDVRPYLKAMDIFCLPSEREGFGMSVLEASAMRLPVLCSDIYGLSDSFVEGVTGMKFCLNNENDFTVKLKMLLADSQLREKLGQNGRMRVEREFQQKDVVNAYLNFFLGQLYGSR